MNGKIALTVLYMMRPNFGNQQEHLRAEKLKKKTTT